MKQKLSLKILTHWVTAGVLTMGLLFQPCVASGAAKHLSTGFGKNNRQPHPEYSLKLVFTFRPSGYFLADIKTEFFRDGKKIEEIASPGPWLFVDLPPGQYSVAASRDNGEKQGARFSITPNSQQVVVLSWPEK